MLVVCKEDNKGYYGLTPGKQYKVVDQVRGPVSPSILYYKVVNDVGNIQGWIRSDLFIPLDEYRNDKLNKIGI